MEGVQLYGVWIVSGLATIDLVGDNADLNCEVYFKVLYPFWVIDHLRPSKVHHCLSLVTIGCSWYP